MLEHDVLGSDSPEVGVKPMHLRRAVAWVKDEPFGVEHAEIDVAEDHLTARGVGIGAAPMPYRLDYDLVTTAGFVTESLRATTRGDGWRRDLDLRRDRTGVWSIDTRDAGDVDLPPAGGNAVRLTGALDCDLGLSPVTNMMPILRHRLLDGGGPIELTMAWVAVPALAVEPDGQRYRHVRSTAERHVIRYEATDGGFHADITLDADAVVVDYPGIGRQLTEIEPGSPTGR